jgi:hypothetical protein
MPVSLSPGAPVPPVISSPSYVLPAHVWVKLPSDVRARVSGLFAQLALNLVLARTRGDLDRIVSPKKETGHARPPQRRQAPR